MKAIIGVFCAMALAVFATNVDAKKYAGFKGGVNIAELGGDDASENSSSRTGFDGGLFYGVDFSDAFGGRIEGLYVMKGGEGEFVIPGDDHAHESIIKLDYIEIPVLFQANFPAGEKLAFNLFAGPTFAFNIGAEVEVPGHNEVVDISDNVESFEFGAAVGGGAEYKVSSMWIVFDVRYSMGASNVVDAADADVKTRGIGIMAGLKFPLGAQ